MAKRAAQIETTSRETAPPAAPPTPAGTSPDGLTPAMRQYVVQKASVPDALLLLRMGDFYEMFYEDAQTASRVLGITLTSRGKDKSGAPVPLAGIPYHALESYLTKLVRAGFKVAISEQVEDPRSAKGVVKREIVRIVTPGTLTDDALLEQRADNYLACVCGRGNDCGLSFVELSTGAFWVQALAESELLSELARLAPAELLLSEMPIDADDRLSKLLAPLSGHTETGAAVAITRRPAHLFDPWQADQRLRKHFGVATLEGFGFGRMDASLCAAAVLLDYLAETQKTALQHIVKLARREASDYVGIDPATWRSLEIERTIRSGHTSGTLLAAVDRTATAMGARCLRRWLAAPLRDAARIRERQDAVSELLRDMHRLTALRIELRSLADIERITARLGVGRASPRDLVALGRTLLAGEKIAELLELRIADCELRIGDQVDCGLRIADCGFLQSRAASMRGQRELAEYLTRSLQPDAPLVLNEGGIIAAGCDAELDRLRAIGSDGRQWLADYQARQIERCGIPTLKVGFNQVFGYYIEVAHAHSGRVPADYIRKQTVKNAERYITDELKQYETEVLTARERADQREAELFEEVRRHVAKHIPALQQLATAVSEIDVVAGLAHLADERRYVRPELVDEIALEIVDGRHPVLEQTLGEKFVPNDCHLGRLRIADCELQIEDQNPARKCGARPGTGVPGSDSTQSAMLMLITGPNMAGKSTFIRQVALLTLLAQTGSFVPAKAMRFSPVDRLFARIGASDELSRGQSTFMVEMTEAANILNNATERSLIILDELGRGTSTFDGLSLAWAIAEQLVTQIGCRSLFATHYHELTQLESYLAGAVNFNVAVREWQDEIVFLYRIVRGGTDKSYGVHVAKLAGVPATVIRRSRELLAELESNFSAGRGKSQWAAKRTKREDQMLLFPEPGDDVLSEIRALDPNTVTPVEALNAIQRWRNRLGS